MGQVANMGFGSTALKLIQTFFYAIAFCCSATILGFYSYFLAIQADRDRAIPQWQKAVEGMSGIGVVYTIFAVILTCCLGGKAFFAFLATSGSPATTNARRSSAHRQRITTLLAAAPSGSSADAATRPAMMLMLRMLRLRVLSVCHQLLFVHRKRLATQPTHTLTTSTTTTLQFQPLVATTLPQLVAVSTHMAMTTATQAGTSKPVHADGRRSCRSSAGMVFSCGSKCLRFYDTLIPLNRRISFQQRTCKE